jgi:membrane protein
MPTTQTGQKERPPSFLKAIGLIGAAVAVDALLTPDEPDRADKTRIGGKSSAEEPLELQRLRAVQPGRGRTAAHPGQIPWRGWKDIFWRAYQEIQEDRLLAIAAGVVFFALLALFPAITAIVSMYGLFAKPDTISEHVGLISAVAPQEVVDVVVEQINRLLAKGETTLGVAFVVGLAIAIWSANAGMKAIIDALNVVYEETEKRSFIMLNIVSLTFTVGAVVAVLLAIGAVVVVPLLLDRVGLGGFTERLIEFGRWPAMIVAVLFGLALLYRYGPSRARAKWKWLSVGSIAATLLWLAGSAVFSYYLRNYANYDATYGSLGTGIGLMMWMWMSTVVVLFGAELNAEIEHQTARDTTTGAPRPLGGRGATMADTVGARPR